MPSRYAKIAFCFLMTIVLAGSGWSQGIVPKPDLSKLPDDPAAIIAVVGESRILLGDVKPKAEARIKQVMKETKQEFPPEQLEMARAGLIRQLLAQAIQSKMMRESFLLDTVGTEAADKVIEAREMMASRARQMFIETEVGEMKEKYKVNDMTELDNGLREEGTSRVERRNDFVDAMLGHMYVRNNVPRDPEVSLAEIVAYYKSNEEKYRHRAKARWEQLSVLFSRFTSKQEAHDAISAMGREAYFGGNMQAVARDQSQEPFADKGGLHEWTNQGALASSVLDEQIFKLPLNAMSQIIEDDQGYHIIRILERKNAGITPLREIQEVIEKEIKKQKVAESERKVMADMRARVPVWTIFPDDWPGSKPLPQTAARPSAVKSR